MSDIDKELEAKVDTALREFAENVLVALDPSAPGDVMVTNPTAVILQIFREEQSDLLSRIKEEVVGENTNTHRVYCDLTYAVTHEIANDEDLACSCDSPSINERLTEQRTKLDNIAKEIRGEM